MVNLEIVVNNPDLVSMECSYTDDTVFLTQIEVGEQKNVIMLSKEAAKQTIAALSAFIADAEPHKSDCALHNSPAYTIEPCNCRHNI